MSFNKECTTPTLSIEDQCNDPISPRAARAQARETARNANPGNQTPPSRNVPTTSSRVVTGTQTSRVSKRLTQRSSRSNFTNGQIAHVQQHLMASLRDTETAREFNRQVENFPFEQNTGRPSTRSPLSPPLSPRSLPFNASSSQMLLPPPAVPGWAPIQPLPYFTNHQTPNPFSAPTPFGPRAIVRRPPTPILAPMSTPEIPIELRLTAMESGIENQRAHQTLVHEPVFANPAEQRFTYL